jgi:hypothetical protein
LLPEIKRQQTLGKEVVFRADAAFAKPEIYEALEGRGVKYAIRIPANDILERGIAELLPRPLGRPSHKPVILYKSFLYQAATVWEHGPADRLAALARRVGERQTGADFGGERGRGGESVRGIGRKRVSFEFWDSAERQNRPVPRPLRAPCTNKSTGP